MELPSCEAIDVRKVNIGSIVRAVTKFKTAANLKVHTEFKIGTNFKTGTDLKVFTDFKAGTKHKAGTNIKVHIDLKLLPSSKLVV